MEYRNTKIFKTTTYKASEISNKSEFPYATGYSNVFMLFPLEGDESQLGSFFFNFIENLDELSYV